MERGKYCKCNRETKMWRQKRGKAGGGGNCYGKKREICSEKIGSEAPETPSSRLL